MSRIGRQPILIPKGVKIQLSGVNVHVEGPKGKLDLAVHPRMKIDVKDSQVSVSRPTETKQDKSLHGLTRSLISNMIKGVAEEFSKTLELHGIGFRAEMKGKALQLALGYSHPIIYDVPEGVKVQVPKPTMITVTGPDKTLVGQVSANIRRFYEPEPYKGKGVRYAGEQLRKKAGKAAG